MSTVEAPIESIIDDIEDAAGEGEVTLGELLDSFEDRSLGVVLAIFGFLVSLPVIGAIPGLPDVASAVILLAVFHSFAGGQSRFRAPGFLRRRSLDAGKMRRMLEKVRPYGRRVDAVLGRRMGVLVDSAAARTVIAISAALLAVAMFVLSLVPGLAIPAALGVLAFGLALMARDGLLALMGYLFTAGAAVALVFAVNWAL